MKGSGGPRPGAGRPKKVTQCSTCIHWTVDTPEESIAANDPLYWWGSCSQLRIQTEQDFLCNKFFRKHSTPSP